MPVEAENGGDGANAEGFEEESGEHEEHGGEERNGGAELGGPVAVGEGAEHGGEAEKEPHHRLEEGVQRRRQVAEVVKGDVGHGGYAEAGVVGKPPH